jgi:hypothetical protein
MVPPRRFRVAPSFTTKKTSAAAESDPAAAVNGGVGGNHLGAGDRDGDGVRPAVERDRTVETRTTGEARIQRRLGAARTCARAHDTRQLDIKYAYAPIRVPGPGVECAGGDRVDGQCGDDRVGGEAAGAKDAGSEDTRAYDSETGGLDVSIAARCGGPRRTAYTT